MSGHQKNLFVTLFFFLLAPSWTLCFQISTWPRVCGSNSQRRAAGASTEVLPGPFLSRRAHVDGASHLWMRPHPSRPSDDQPGRSRCPGWGLLGCDARLCSEGCWKAPWQKEKRKEWKSLIRPNWWLLGGWVPRTVIPGLSSMSCSVKKRFWGRRFGGRCILRSPCKASQCTPVC